MRTCACLGPKYNYDRGKIDRERGIIQRIIWTMWGALKLNFFYRRSFLFPKITITIDTPSILHLVSKHGIEAAFFSRDYLKKSWEKIRNGLYWGIIPHSQVYILYLRMGNI